jgi:transposase
MIRTLRVARSTAVKARTQAVNALKALVVTAPSDLREQLRASSTARLVYACARLRPGELVDATAATKVALRSLATRYEALEAELERLNAALVRLVGEAAPELVPRCGVGPDSAGVLLVAAGDNPGRLRSEVAFAMLSAASPIEASSGKIARHRLNRGGDRQANAALYNVVMSRLRWDKPTQGYMARRTAEGRTGDGR